MRRLLLIGSVAAAVAFGQAFPPSAGGSSGSATPGGSSGAVQFNDAGALGGNPSFQFFATPLTQAPNPTVTPTCTTGGGETCSTTYIYDVAWIRAVNGNMVGTLGQTTIANGPNTINSTNHISINPGSCPTGVGSYLVMQESPNSGVIGSHTCGSAYVDNGGYVFDLIDGDGPYPRSFDSSTGVATPPLVVAPSVGPYPSFYVGPPVWALSSLWRNINAFPATTAGAQITQSAASNSSGGLAVNLDATTGGFSVGVLSNSAVAGGTLYGFESNIVGGDGANNLVGYVATLNSTVAAETVTNMIGFQANGLNVTGSMPTVAEQHIGFLSRNQTGIAGVGKDFSFFGAGGTAHIETGGDAYVAIEAMRSTSAQTADLFRTLDQDGVTVLPFHVLSNGYAAQSLHTPSSSTEACTTGQFSDDASFHYVCVSSGVWKRVALSSF